MLFKLACQVSPIAGGNIKYSVATHFIHGDEESRRT